MGIFNTPAGDAVIEAAEDIVRGAVGDVEQTIESVSLPLRVAADQLTQAACAAQGALERLYEAAQVYTPLQAEAVRQVAALGLPATHSPNADATAFETGIDVDGLLILRGTAYAAHSPADVLLKALLYVLSENAGLPAGTRLELRMRRLGGGGE